MAGLVLKGIGKSFGPVEVLRGIDLDVADGEFVVFVGPSGCGKSTLLRVIAGLEEVTSGTILIDGQDVTTERAAERGLAMVFQSYALYPHMSVYRNIAFALENMRLPPAEIEARVRRAATMLRLTDYLDRKPGALSGGQRQRVAIGRAVVRDPKIFLFDEPLSNLDAELRVATRKELAGLHAEIGGTMIYVTHDQVEAMTLANRIVVLNKGRIEQVGTPLELYNRPANLFVAGFIGSPRMNFIRGQVTPEGRLVTPDGKVTLPLPAGHAPGAEITLGIRPEHVLPAGGEAPDAILTVDLVEKLGSEAYLYGTLADGTALTLRSPLEDPARRGDSLPIRFERQRLHLFDAAGLAIRP
ncbi:MAG: sn-glycerol-3-phosphate ABC transporter ATP-binding protein UgpC [Beijerinckiaceae bacterium]|nr:sn-glycerol-3-phosphate ABC transporter ATP-binding protein UgpC [Beijerinckiaceae bacterium]MCZ8298758.1 sn-glycerol-3-phosphate ABC transporter ATP-binding protein UgpC [Beijerinckiaceae bacterium]